MCVHIHTDYRYGRWRGAWNTDLVFSNTDFYVFEHEFHSWCLRNIILARIKRIVMNGTGTRNWSKGSHTDLSDLTDFLMQGRIDGMKRIFRKRTFSWKTDGIFMRWNEYLCKRLGRLLNGLANHSTWGRAGPGGSAPTRARCYIVRWKQGIKKKMKK